MAHYHLGLIAATQGGWSEALCSLPRACEPGSTDGTAARLLALALLRQDRPHDARRVLDAFLEREPKPQDLRLRAHVMRALGEPAAAASDLDGIAPAERTPEDNLLLAETLINAGRTKAAVEIARQFSTSNDPRWKLIRSELDRANGRRSNALKRLAKLARSEEVGEQAVVQIVRIVAESGSGRQVRPALDAVPAELRDNGYWTIAGNWYASQQDWSKALEMWSNVSVRGTALDDAMAAARHHHLADLYNAGRFETLLDEVKNGILSAVDASTLLPIVTSALACWASSKVDTEDSGVEDVATMLGEITEHLPALAEEPATQRLYGVIYSLQGSYDVGLDLLRPALDDTSASNDTLLHLGRCALYAGDLQTCRAVLTRLDGDSRGHALLAATTAAEEGQWDQSWAYLEETCAAEQVPEFYAAAAFQSGEPGALEPLEERDGFAQYYRGGRRITQRQPRTW